MTSRRVMSATHWRRPCPICGKNLPRLLHANRMVPLDGRDLSYLVSRCGHCGFHYAADLPRPAVYDDYYRRLSKYDQPQAVLEPTPLERQRFDTALQLVAPYLTSRTAIADFGCGSGMLLNHFHEAGYSALYGTDPSPKAAQALGIARIYTGGIQRAIDALPISELGLVCLMGVLEHLPKLHEALATLLENLPAETKILIEVPALESFGSEKGEPFGEFSIEHLQYFDLNSLTALMSHWGLQLLVHRLQPLEAACDSHFALFSRQAPAITHSSPDVDSAGIMDRYIAASRRMLDETLDRATEALGDDYLIYGAGSHTARLIPELEQRQLAGGIFGVIDSNPNLAGKTLGNHTIGTPHDLERFPGIPILVSSFHAQEAIIGNLAARGMANPLIRLYP